MWGSPHGRKYDPHMKNPMRLPLKAEKGIELGILQGRSATLSLVSSKMRCEIVPVFGHLKPNKKGSPSTLICSESSLRFNLHIFMNARRLNGFFLIPLSSAWMSLNNSSSWLGLPHVTFISVFSYVHLNVPQTLLKIWLNHPQLKIADIVDFYWERVSTQPWKKTWIIC